MEAEVQGKVVGLSTISDFCLSKRTCVRLCLATVALLSFLGICLMYYPDHFSLPPFLSATFPAHPNRTVTLMIWAHPFGSRELPDCFAQYKIDGCRIIDDRNAYPQADAVIIHHREIGAGSVQLPPQPRPSAQKWIWMNYESPSHTPRLESFEGVFNLTMSYRKDSNIFIPYGHLVPLGRQGTGVAQPLHIPPANGSRPNFVAWVISNWSEGQARVAFYHKLTQYIEVDVFGHGHRPLPKESGDNVAQLVRQYMFYLAMENSQHTDYITEKLWNAILAGAIPVVLGPSRQNYERFLPPDAFIHADDFPTVEALVRYLQLLRLDPGRMKKHLDWRASYSMHQIVFWSEQYCTACKAVKSRLGRTDVVQSLAQWYKS